MMLSAGDEQYAVQQCQLLRVMSMSLVGMTLQLRGDEKRRETISHLGGGRESDSSSSSNPMKGSI